MQDKYVVGNTKEFILFIIFRMGYSKPTKMGDNSRGKKKE